MASRRIAGHGTVFMIPVRNHNSSTTTTGTPSNSINSRMSTKLSEWTIKVTDVVGDDVATD